MASYVVKNASTDGQYYTYNLTDPDEYANQVNNGAYTNAGIAQLLQWATTASQIVGQAPDPQWADIINNIYIPQQQNIDLTLEYSGMNSSTLIKQADVVLLTYPLEFNQSSARAVNNLNYYAQKQSPNGPAMTYAIFAVDVAQLSTQGCSAYTYLLYSSQPYIRYPFYQFSEQLVDNPNLNGGTNPAFPFLTGHGGHLQVYTHGLTGYRANQSGLYLDPTLPPQMTDGYSLTGLKYNGGVFDINITLTNTTITRRADWKYCNLNGSYFPEGPGKPINVIIGSRNPKAGNYSLQINGTLTVPTYRPDLNGPAIDGNLVQCKPILSEDAWVPGKFPLSLNDGDNSTLWQPLTPSFSTAFIDLGNVTTFSSAYFLWGNEPPLAVSLGIDSFSGGNISIAQANATSFQWIVSNYSVSINQPYSSNQTNSSSIVIYPGNDTTLKLNSTYSSRYIQVAIEGSYTDNGGTLAELALM
jgi:hypothetical protein